MKKVMCCRVNKGFEEMFTPGQKYDIITAAPNRKAWNIKHPHGEVIFVAAVGSIFGTFAEVYE